MTIGLIINPRSGRRSGKGLRLHQLLSGKAGICVRVIEDFGSLPTILREFSAGGVRALVISSGDGTIQAIQTELAERNPFPVLPPLLLVPHGTSNMTAADLGLGISNPDAVAALLCSDSGLETLDRKQRPTLRAANLGAGGPRHGMFLGAGSIYDGTRFCQEKVYRTGTRGNLAIAFTLAAAVGNALLHTGNSSGAALARPYRFRIDAGRQPIVDGDHLLFLATTLDRLVLGIRPFWGGKSAPIRATLIPYPVPNLMRWLWPAMYGPEDRQMPPGSLSMSVHALEVWSASGFVIDGEFFDAPSGALHIETGRDFTYLCGAAGRAV
jgi:hypothetical protein